MPTAGSHIPKPVVFVIDSSGNVGRATVNALSVKYGRKIDIRAGVRNPETVAMFKHLTGVSTVQVEMGEYERLKELLNGVKVLLISPPDTENRGELAQRTAEAAKDSGVSHIVAISHADAGKQDTIFGQQFYDVEQAVLQLGIPCTILRLPWLMENYFSFKHSIQKELIFSAPVDGMKAFPVVCMDDAGAAAAAILASPEKHAGKIYTIVSDRNTFELVSEALSRALSREISYVRVSYDECRDSLRELGLAAWTVEGFLQYYATVDDGSALEPGGDEDFKEITGKNPTKLVTWMNRFASAFK